MKKTTHFTIVFALLFSTVLNLKAGTWTMNNPLTLAQTTVDTTTEPQNKSWKKPTLAENLRLRIDTKIKDLEKEKAQNQAKLDEPNTHLTEKQKDKITLSIKDLDSRLAELNTSKADMERLGNDPNHIYIFSNIGENGVTKRTNKEIVIHGANDALWVHEIRHISLWLQTGRNFRFGKYDALMPIFAGGSFDEWQSYRAQYAFEPHSLPGKHLMDMEAVNIEFIANIQKEDHSFAYPSLRKMWQEGIKITELQAVFKQGTQGVYSTTASH